MEENNLLWVLWGYLIGALVTSVLISFVFGWVREQREFDYEYLIFFVLLTIFWPFLIIALLYYYSIKLGEFSKGKYLDRQLRKKNNATKPSSNQNKNDETSSTEVQYNPKDIPTDI